MAVLIDCALVVCLVLTMIVGARSGFFKELFSLLGLAGGVWLATRFTPVVLHMLPPFFRGSAFLAIVLFLILFFLTFALLRLVGTAFSALWEGKSPSGLSHLFGLVLGTVRGLVLVVFLSGALVLLAPLGSVTLGHSRVLPFLSSGMTRGAELLPPDVRARFLRRWEALPLPGHKPAGGAQVLLGGPGGICPWEGPGSVPLDRARRASRSV
jgi:uncharacterized membrane protein required for colicin V production